MLPRAERPSVVVTSPYTRCMQTAAAILANLTDGQSTLYVSASLQEIQDPKILKVATAPPPFSRLAEYPLSLPSGAEVVLPVEYIQGDMPTPPFPETLLEGHRRYHAAFNKIPDGFPGRNVLLVTHGEVCPFMGRVRGRRVIGVLWSRTASHMCGVVVWCGMSGAGIWTPSPPFNNHHVRRGAYAASHHPPF
eukprot:Sspe_Gene.59830::Locus_32898_Transcript_1_1_Confidence_1.000_Length_624::g.59830::m.59830